MKEVGRSAWSVHGTTVEVVAWLAMETGSMWLDVVDEPEDIRGAVLVGPGPDDAPAYILFLDAQGDVLATRRFG